MNNMIWTCSNDYIDQWCNPGNQAFHCVCQRLGVSHVIAEPKGEGNPGVSTLYRAEGKQRKTETALLLKAELIPEKSCNYWSWFSFDLREGKVQSEICGRFQIFCCLQHIKKVFWVILSCPEVDLLHFRSKV